MTFISQYHYHFYPQADSSGYDGCLVSQCSPDVASDIVGVAYDGFPIYGPTQDWFINNQITEFSLVAGRDPSWTLWSGFQQVKIEFITIQIIARIVN